MKRRKLRKIEPVGPVAREFYRISQVLAATGLSQSTLYEEIKAGRFPRPVSLSDGGRRVAWVSDEVKAWQSERIAARDAS